MPVAKRCRTRSSVAASQTQPPAGPAAGASQSQTLVGPLGALMYDATLSDCVIVVERKEYWCIRAILAQGSSWFKAKFFGTDKGRRPAERVVLKDVTTAGWLAARLWLYTASVRLSASASAVGALDEQLHRLHELLGYGS